MSRNNRWWYEGGRKPSQEDIESELHSLARSRTVGEYRTGGFLALGALWGKPRWDSTSGVPLYGWDDALASAIARIRDPGHREAASALFGSHALRWTSLRERQTMAARHFGVGYDAYRRRRRSGMSLYEETVAELARSIVALGDLPPAPSSTVPNGGGSPLRTGTLEVTTVNSMGGQAGGYELRVRVPEDVYRQLQKMALEQNVDLGELLRRALLLEDFAFANRDKHLILSDEEDTPSEEVVLNWK